MHTTDESIDIGENATDRKGRKRANEENLGGGPIRKMSSWPFQVDGVDVFRLPPDGYVVDFANPKQQKVLDHYLIFGIGAPIAFVALLQRFYTKMFLSKGLQIDDGKLPSGQLSSCVSSANGLTTQASCF